jgi:hypothetical protein
MVAECDCDRQHIFYKSSQRVVHEEQMNREMRKVRVKIQLHLSTMEDKALRLSLSQVLA